MYSWSQNLVNLKTIFDKYLPMTREVYAWVTVHRDEFRDLQLKIQKLSERIEELKKKNEGEVIPVEEPSAITEEPTVPSDEIVIEEDDADKMGE